MKAVTPLFKKAETLLTKRVEYFRQSLQYIGFVRATIYDYERNLSDPLVDKTAVLKEIDELKVRSRKRIIAAHEAMAQSQQMMWDVIGELNSILKTTKNANIAEEIEDAILKYEIVLKNWLPAHISSKWSFAFD